MGHSAKAAAVATRGEQTKGTGLQLRATSVFPGDSKSCCVLQINAEGLVIGFDAGAPRIFGHPAELLTGCHIDTLLLVPDGGELSKGDALLSPRRQRPIVARHRNGAAIAVDVICVEAMSDKLAIKLLLVRNTNEPDVQGPVQSRQDPIHSRHVSIVGDASCSGDISNDSGSVYQRRLRQVLLHSASEERMATLLFLDIPDMADIADLYGGSVAEMLCSNMEARINKCLRRGDVAACVEQEEFVAIIHDVNDGDIMRMVVDRITKAIRQPFLILGREFSLTGDVGTQLYAINGNKPQELLEHFDRAMQRAYAGRAASFSAPPQLSS